MSRIQKAPGTSFWFLLNLHHYSSSLKWSLRALTMDHSLPSPWTSSKRYKCKTSSLTTSTHRSPTLNWFLNSWSKFPTGCPKGMYLISTVSLIQSSWPRSYPLAITLVQDRCASLLNHYSSLLVGGWLKPSLQQCSKENSSKMPIRSRHTWNKHEDPWCHRNPHLRQDFPEPRLPAIFLLWKYSLLFKVQFPSCLP